MNDKQLKGLQDAISAKLAGKPWQYRYSNTGMSTPRAPSDWLTERAETDLGLLDLSVYDFRAAPEPVYRPWSKPEDVPGPVCWIRRDARYHGAMIVGITDDTIITSDLCELVELTWAKAAQNEHSTDRKTWHPCTVEEPS